MVRMPADMKGKQLVYNFLPEGVSCALVEPNQFRASDLTVSLGMYIYWHLSEGITRSFD